MSGPILLAKAEEFAKKLEVENFKASTGWLERFKERNGITFKQVCGEAKSADTASTDMTEWEQRLRRLLDQYTPNDIYNADKTGVFYRLLPNKTLEYKKVDCHGGKKSKERLMAVVCTNMSGNDKLPLLIIGKSANPRCFKNKKTLPMPYTSNKKAWMTSEIFTNWLKKLDQKLQRQKRKITMVIDNCPAIPQVRGLKCIELISLQDPAYGARGDSEFQDPLQKESHSATDESNRREEGVYHFYTRRHETNATGLGDGAAKNNR